LGVPVGEAEAAAGFGATDFFRNRRAVDAVAGAVEPEPDRADGIVGAGLDDEFFRDALPLGRRAQNVRVKSVVGAFDADGYFEFADGPLGHIAGDADRTVEEQFAGGIKCLELSFLQLDLNPANFLTEVVGDDQRREDAVACAQGGPVDSGIDAADRVGIGAGFFSHHFERGMVAEVTELPALAPAGWLRGELGHGRCSEFDIDVCRLFDSQPFIQGRIPFSGDGQSPVLLKSSQCLLGLAAKRAVNGAR